MINEYVVAACLPAVDCIRSICLVFVCSHLALVVGSGSIGRA